MPSETIRLTAKFKLKETPEGLEDLFQTYREIVNFLITYAFENNVTSFYRLKKETYKSLRKEYSGLPSHYLYTACQMATAIFKSFRKRRRKGKARRRPVFKKEVIMLDDHLFKLDLESRALTSSPPEGRGLQRVNPLPVAGRFAGPSPTPVTGFGSARGPGLRPVTPTGKSPIGVIAQKPPLRVSNHSGAVF